MANFRWELLLLSVCAFSLVSCTDQATDDDDDDADVVADSCLDEDDNEALDVPGECESIQAAVDAAIDGWAVNVAAGTWSEDVTVEKELTILGVDGAESTFIEGNIELGYQAQLSGFTIDSVSLSDGEISDVVLTTGGALSGGAASFTRVVSWGTLLIRSAAVVVFDSCSFEGAEDAAVEIEDSCQVEFSSCVFHQNGYGIKTQSDEGGTIGIVVSNSLFLDNGTAVYGGYKPNSDRHIDLDMTLVNCNLIRNNTGLQKTVTLEPSAYDWETQHPQTWDVRNNIIAHNGTGAYVSTYPTDDFAFAYNLFYENDDDFDYTRWTFNGTDTFNGSQSQTLGSNTLWDDPEFVSYSGMGGVEDLDLHLLETSPGVDAGDPSAEYSDADGTPNDLGMYGGPNGAW